MTRIRRALAMLLTTTAAPAVAAAPPTPAVLSFPPDAVRIDGGPLRAAQDADKAYLLKLNPDALLHYVRLNAGLAPKADHYGGWEAHGNGIIGHYLSACARMAAATGDPELRRRVGYIVDELAACQKAKGSGGLFSFASDVRYFDLLARNKVLTPPVNGWYVMHKMMAGTRDAYLLTGTPASKRVFLALCDWACDVTRGLTDAQWQTMLQGEHGAPHEVLADAYAVTGDAKYLDCARKFCHHRVFDPLARGDASVLNGLHANTNIAKFVGYERVYEVGGDPTYRDAAAHFWADVVAQRSWVIGGDSQWEAFFDPADTRAKMEQVCGPETCNTYNMLKLTAMQYRLRPDARKIDFYERATFNHILSSQSLNHGGFVYYTTMRPGGYRTFSTDYDSFWCCVGTGMENHARYDELIYAHTPDDATLFVNLFVPSTLTWPAKNMTVRQTTDFPAAGRSTLTVDAPTPRPLTLNVRYPSWVRSGEFKLAVNGRPVDTHAAKPGTYVAVARTWQNGDTVSLMLPMHLSTELLATTRDYAAVLYGPIVLAGTMGDAGLTPDDFHPHNPSGNMLARKRFPETDAPVVLAAAAADLPARIRRVAGKPLTFTTAGLTRPGPVTLVPMWTLGDQRYVVYFHLTDERGYTKALGETKAEERAAADLDRRTIDQVRVGEQQPEADHHLQSRQSNTGTATTPYDHWRDATGFFSYDLAVDPARGPLAVRCVYWGDDAGRTFDIVVDQHVIATQSLTGASPGRYFDVAYNLPPALLVGKNNVTVRFQPHPGSNAGGVVDVRIVAAKQVRGRPA